MLLLATLTVVAAVWLVVAVVRRARWAARADARASAAAAVGDRTVVVPCRPVVGEPTRRERRRRLRQGAPDPFTALHVQHRLAAVAEQARALEADPRVYARAERLRAYQLAYDDLLVEACRLAGIEVRPREAVAAHERFLGDESVRRPGLDAQERFREELALAERGWSW